MDSAIGIRLGAIVSCVESLAARVAALEALSAATPPASPKERPINASMGQRPLQNEG